MATNAILYSGLTPMSNVCLVITVARLTDVIGSSSIIHNETVSTMLSDTKKVTAL